MASRAIHLTNPPDHISDLSEPFRSGPTTKPTAIMPPTRTRGVAAKDNFSSRWFRFRPQITPDSTHSF